MGYRTWYNLSLQSKNVVDKPANSLEIIAQLREECEEAHYALDDQGNGQMETSWDAIDDLPAFSLKHPDVIFAIDYTGDDSEDFGFLYVMNGKSQDCPAIITYDEFDESKLK